jgi:hypothetical protein
MRHGSGSQDGDAGQTTGGTARQRRPVTVTSVAARRSGGPLATPLLRHEELILHPLELLHLRIAIVVNGRHADCQSFYRRASLMECSHWQKGALFRIARHARDQSAGGGARWTSNL